MLKRWMEINTFQQEKGLYVFDSIISSILQSNTFRDKAIVLFSVIMHYIMLQTESISKIDVV